MNRLEHAENLGWLLGVITRGDKWVDLNDMPNSLPISLPDWQKRHWAHDNLVKIVRPFFHDRGVYWAREEGLLLLVRSES